MGSVIKNKLIPVLTDAGQQAVFQSDTKGLKVDISHIAIGSGRYEPDEKRTALEDEQLRVDILSSSIDKVNHQITLNAIFKDEENDFWINEIGFFLEDGTLFAVWSDPIKALSYKSVFSKPIFAFTLKIVNTNIDAINIIDRGLDLQLNYFQEFLLTTGAISKLSLTMLNFHDKLKKAIAEFSKMVSTHKEEIGKNMNELKSLFINRNSEIDRFLLQTFVTSTKDNLHRLQMFYKQKEEQKLRELELIQQFEALRVDAHNDNAKQNKIANDRYLVTLTNTNAILKINEREVTK